MTAKEKIEKLKEMVRECKDETDPRYAQFRDQVWEVVKDDGEEL